MEARGRKVKYLYILPDGRALTSKQLKDTVLMWQKIIMWCNRGKDGYRKVLKSEFEHSSELH